jgi:predicted PurR-regulated permease PerM
MQQQQADNRLFFITLILIAAALLYFLRPMLTPFFAGALIAYLENPLVNKLMTYHLSRLTSSIIVFFLVSLIFVLLLLLLIPLIQMQITALTDVIPNSIAWVQSNIVPWFQHNLGLNEEWINVDTVKKMLTENADKASGAAGWLLQTVFVSGVKVIELVINLILIPVVTFYLLCDWDKFMQGLINLIPKRKQARAIKLAQECNSVLGAFFRGQLIIMLALGVIYSIGLMLIGLQVGLIIGLISGLLSIVPYLGFIVGIVVASIAAVVQFGTTGSVLLVVLVFAVGHLIDHMFLTPKLMGDRIGLHPVAVIFAILAGGCLFGFMGVLLALPMAAVIMVWVRFLYKRYRRSQVYQH